MEIMNISGIDCYEENGTVYLNLEAVARGLGFTTVATSGNEVVRWQRVHGHLADLGVATSCNGKNYQDACPDFIPENVFYRLAMKAKNEAAEIFQAKIADEVIPSIRKHGAYIAGQEKMTDEQLFAKALVAAQNIINGKQQMIEQQQQIIGELKPKADYTDRILKNKGLVNISQIAKDYGMSGQAMNEKLHQLGVQYKSGDQWLLYAKYQSCGYTHSDTVDVTHKDGTMSVKMRTKWTQKGRLFIYDLLKNEGILPIIERKVS